MSCFGGHDEQLYLVELMVDKLRLTPDKIKDVGKSKLVVKIRFLDFPIFAISTNDFTGTMKSSMPDKDGVINLSIGKSCLFVRRPKVLVEELKKTALNFGVFCEGDTYPIAECEIPFSGCLCDQVAMAQNDPDHAPEPYSLKGGFHLVDPGENPSGTIHLDVRLVCLGKSVSTQYQLDSKSFLFKNDKDESEFCVKPVITTGVPGDAVELEEMKSPDSILPESFDEDKRSHQTSK